MKEKEIQEIIDMNYRALTLLGYATSLIMDYRETCVLRHTDEKKKCDWFLEALNNVVYLNKPLPEMP